MKHLIVTADDYGVFPAINTAVIEAVKAKKVNSVSVLSNYKGNEEFPGSVENLRTLIEEVGEGADIGCHLTITSGKPITDKMDFACDDEGNFLSYTEFKNFKSQEEKDALKEELCEQINNLHSVTGFKIKHLTNHHNSLTLFPHHFDVYMEVARKYNVPMRSAFIKPEARQNFYLRFLNFKLQDDINKTERNEIKEFEKKIVKYFEETSGGIKAPKFLDSRHYGPVSLLPLANIIGRWKIVLQKKASLNELFDLVITSDDESLELLVHLAKPKRIFVDRSNEIKYSGVDRNYFDSRALEFKSIMDYDFNKWEGIKHMGWDSLK
jgi:predicted glycoside hydrolase/deacetylase ChbG (UPF0249 family)